MQSVGITNIVILLVISHHLWSFWDCEQTNTLTKVSLQLNAAELPITCIVFCPWIDTLSGNYAVLIFPHYRVSMRFTSFSSSVQHSVTSCVLWETALSSCTRSVGDIQAQCDKLYISLTWVLLAAVKSLTILPNSQASHAPVNSVQEHSGGRKTGNE